MLINMAKKKGRRESIIAVGQLHGCNRELLLATETGVESGWKNTSGTKAMHLDVQLSREYRP